ncbi:MAG: dihydroorotate dehydrogenase-like protein [Bacteroidales bacterium]|jgi:dihydroorotate dehydrogenase (fumarate)|nr:dihydroorotate dehydrogenase-like protein [Bacteroidales bacterium]MDZ4059173.1 dihydroorotate dehydrogenase-like protein [Bacteroidales bacterium]
MSNISVNYMGLNLASPIMAASSGLTAQLDRVAEFEKAGVGAIVVKSLFEEQIVNEAEFLHAQSHDYPESADYLHHYLRQNSIDRYLKLVSDVKKSVSVPVIASINCYSAGEWTAFAKEIESAGADGLELNIYSLPLNIHKKSEDVEREYLNVVSQVSKLIKIPIAVKIASNFTNLPGFVNSLKAHGAKAVVMFNRFYSPDIDIKRVRVFPADAFSSPEESLRELRWMGIISAIVPGIDLSASTGVHNGTTVIKQILAGATTVQMCTALYKKGADAIAHSVDDLHLFMDAQGFKTVADFKGKLNYSNIDNPEKFERVQFMKSFGSK